MSCGEAHSRARELVARGYQVTLVAAALALSRSSLYYRRRARGSRADRQWDEEIVATCGAKPAYGYRRVTWWLRRKEGLRVNRKRVLRERGLLVRSRRLRARRRKEWGRVETERPSSQTIALAFCHAVLPKEDGIMGLPESIYVDNGKDFRSRYLEG